MSQNTKWIDLHASNSSIKVTRFTEPVIPKHVTGSVSSTALLDFRISKGLQHRSTEKLLQIPPELKYLYATLSFQLTLLGSASLLSQNTKWIDVHVSDSSLKVIGFTKPAVPKHVTGSVKLEQRRIKRPL